VRRSVSRVAGAERTTVRALAICPYLVLAVGILVARRPDAVVHPQFWAEDGTVYFAQAYNRGAVTVLAPGAGYLQLIPRLTALLAQPLGLAAAPALFNLVGMLAQLAPALFILSSRFQGAIPDLRVRALVGVLYLLVPNFEVHVTVISAQWHLALLMCMVVIAAPARGLAWRCFDVAVIAVGGLSGPLILVVAPLALIRWLTTRQPWYGVVAAVATLLAIVQVRTIHDNARPDMPLGAGVRSLIRILADRVIVPGLTGEQNSAIFSLHLWHGLLWATLLVVATLALAGLVVLRGPAELRILLAFGAASLALSLRNPLITPTGPQWPPITMGLDGMRYFLLPTLAFVVLVVWGISRLPRPALALAGALLSGLFIAGTATHFQYPPMADERPAAAAATLDAAPRGTVLDLPINPPGWSMSLTKH
jgi:hypothetical protein